jgi:hypothetical protein
MDRHTPCLRFVFADMIVSSGRNSTERCIYIPDFDSLCEGVRTKRGITLAKQRRLLWEIDGGGTEPWQERGTALAQILFDSGAGVTTRLARWAPAGLQLTEAQWRSEPCAREGV